MDRHPQCTLRVRDTINGKMVVRFTNNKIILIKDDQLSSMTINEFDSTEWNISSNNNRIHYSCPQLTSN